MSQKVRILKVRHAGCSVFLGLDSYGNRMWTRNPERIMDWLCDTYDPDDEHDERLDIAQAIEVVRHIKHGAGK